MPDLATIKFGEVSFDEAVAALRSMIPMTEDQFAALSAVAKQRAFSFAGAYSDSMAEAARKVLEGVLAGDVPVNGALDALNHALAPFGESVTPFQADTIFQTTSNRVFNQGHDEAFNSPALVEEYPYIGHVTADDIRVRPNHYALDYRRINGVFRRSDFIWSQMSPPLGFRCRCWKRYFRQDEVDALGLQVLKGEDWYGRSVEVAVPGHGAVVCQCLPETGFGVSGLTGVDTRNLVSISIICLAARAEALELLGEQTHDWGDGHWVTHDGHPLFIPDTPEQKAQIARGKAAVDQALATRADVPDAMSHPDFGEIDFRWGNDKEGVQHVLQRAEDRLKKWPDGPSGETVMRMMPLVIARGKVAASGRVAVIEYNGYRAMLARDLHGKDSNRWLLSGYDVSPEKGGHR